MLFRKTGRLRKEYDEKLVQSLEMLKQDWMNQKNIVEKSVDPSGEVIADLKMKEAKYFYLLREAKKRRITLGKFK